DVSTDGTDVPTDARQSLQCAVGPNEEGPLNMPVRLQFSHLDHCSVIITDVERSRRFYRDVLGLKEINKPRTFDFIVLWFQLGDQQVHLLLKEKADSISPRHFALRVRDVAAARTYFRER